jgi:septum formation protein
MSENKTPSFILASASPRRKELLEKAGYDFEIKVSNVDESQYSSEGKSSQHYALELAFAKAITVAVQHPQRLVLGSDTIVDLDGEIIGKAKDAADAERITRALFSRPHKVITAVALIRIENKIEMADTDTTVVYPKVLSDEQIAAHIKSENWKGKAGAYGIQDSSDEFVAKIEGSFTNVVGMPMELLEKMFEKLTQ